MLLGEGPTAGKYIYADGDERTLIEWSAWATGQPDYKKPCVYARKENYQLKWYTNKCNALFFYVCEPHNYSGY